MKRGINRISSAHINVSTMYARAEIINCSSLASEILASWHYILIYDSPLTQVFSKEWNRIW